MPKTRTVVHDVLVGSVSSAGLESQSFQQTASATEVTIIAQNAKHFERRV